MRYSLIALALLAFGGVVLGQADNDSDVDDQSLTDPCKTKTCNDNNPCTTDSCIPFVGTCVFLPKDIDDPCDDGNACTTNDKCVKGDTILSRKCEGTPKVCTASDQCHTAGTCNPDTGMCSNPAKSDGTTCDDGKKCTTGDKCTAGVCAGIQITCTAQDQCHTVGTCNPDTGMCSNPAKSDGTACDDGKKCTTGDKCAAGVCAGTQITCTAQDQCHTAGTCNPDTGMCSNPAKSVGASCDDGNKCTTSDKCNSSGKCVGTAKTCTSTSPCRKAGTCSLTTGLCSEGALKTGYAECKTKCVKKCSYSRYLESQSGKGCDGKCVACRGYGQTKCGAYCCIGKGNKCVNGKCSK